MESHRQRTLSYLEELVQVCYECRCSHIAASLVDGKSLFGGRHVSSRSECPSDQRLSAVQRTCSEPIRLYQSRWNNGIGYASRYHPQSSFAPPRRRTRRMEWFSRAGRGFVAKRERRRKRKSCSRCICDAGNRAIKDENGS